MTAFSANLGFLWTDRPLPDAIFAAKAAGFDAVECHWPYDVPPEQLGTALRETGLPMLGLNTIRGDVAAGDMGLAALPARRTEAKAAIDQAIAYARAIDCPAVHVMAGLSQGPAAMGVFLDNLRYAATAAPELTILIEPLNAGDASGYFLGTSHAAQEVIARVNCPNLKLMFDCYHIGRTEGHVLDRLHDLLPIVGHIQFAAVPDRGPPDRGDLDYRKVFEMLRHAGWTRPLGAEYRPPGPTDDSLGWMTGLRL
jgi:hydroxypyruvate isomerase